MKYLLLGAAFAGILGYAWFGRGEANVYAMTPADVYAALRAAPIQNDGKSAFGTVSYTVSGDGESKIYWNSGQCEAEITPEGTDKSRIMAFCNSGGFSDGAAAGILSGMHRKALIEHIDATLEKRPFDVKLAQGSTASSWPSDARQPDGSLGTATSEALEMHQAFSKLDRKYKQSETYRQEQAGISNVRFQPGKPMVDVSSGSSR